jgi:beta-alanine degradation protein BauB
MHFKSLARIALPFGLLTSCTSDKALPAASYPALPSAFAAGWKGKQVCEPLFENEKMRAARCTFPPGGGHDRHFHPPHWGYIIQGGTMRITTANGTVDRVLKAGTNWWSDGIDWHEPVNIGTETAVYVIVEPKTAVK